MLPRIKQCRVLNAIAIVFPNTISSCRKNLMRGYTISGCKDDYSKWYAILGISVDSDQENVRIAFLKLVKRYHPDSGSPEANEDKFNQIETAYRELQDKFASERWKMDDGAGEYGLYYQEEKEKVQEFDIQHTAPQHRQYLEYAGYGSGTPQQRQKQYQKLRAMTAVQNVYKHRISKLPQGQESALLVRDKRHAKKNKIRSEIDRLVEDLIQESMARGEFDNLPGTGKPLPPQNNNPYVDFVTHKMNQVLIESGFTPEWIDLQKEISHKKQELQAALTEERARFGPAPLAAEEAADWAHTLDKFGPQVLKLNRKINDFNLQVPILDKQMLFFRLEREANKILKIGRTKFDPCPLGKSSVKQMHYQEEVMPGIFAIFEKFFKG